MKLLVTGANGLVGSHFTENYSQDGDTVLTPPLEEFDITDPKSIESYFKLNTPDAVIHFAAFTDVTLAEKQRGDKKASCWVVNVNGTANLINALNPDSYLIAISTDVIFSGSKDNPGPYGEDDQPEENTELLSWYGATKREAEKIVARRKNSAILRISNPVRTFYEAKPDYVRKILKLYDENKLYPMFPDQYLTLTYINEVTKVLKILLEKRLTGILHASSRNVFTPFKLASYLIEKARGVKNAVLPVSIEEYLKDNPSRYPQYGGLKVEKTESAMGINFMTWEEIIEDLAKQL